MYLEENHDYAESFSIHCSGIDNQLSPDKQSVLIHQVFENSPASRAGIKVDSELVSVNDKTIKPANMQEMIRLLKVDGSSVDLVVKQDGAKKVLPFN